MYKRQGLDIIAKEAKEIEVAYAKKPRQIWDMSKPKQIPSKLLNNNPSDISAEWQTNWDSKHMYFSFAINDESLQKGDQILLTLEPDQNIKTMKDDTKKTVQENKNGSEVEKTKVKTFTFTPFDSLGTQTHLIETDSGYLLNVAIPWKEIYSDESINVSSGDKIGINIIVTDVDENEKGSKELVWADTNNTLPKVILSNTPVSNN